MAETNMKEVKQQLEDQFVHFQTIKNIPLMDSNPANSVDLPSSSIRYMDNLRFFAIRFFVYI